MSAPVEIRFESPAPPILRSDESIAVFTEALRSQPGVWALFGAIPSAGYARQRAYEIRRALRGADVRLFGPAGSFEAESRTLFGEHRVYVRYVGRAVAR